MGEETKNMILSQLRREVLIDSLNKNKRYDGRMLNEFRPIELQFGPVTTAEGSALVALGNTKVLAAVKVTMATPFPDRPKEGVFISNAELLPTASPMFETGPPGEECIELARVVDRAVRSAECIDLDSLYVEPEKVLAVFLDLYVLDHDGNYTDAATIAGVAALMDTKIPKVEDKKVIYGEYERDLNPKAIPISTTFGKIGNYWLIDPSKEEELCFDTKLTIATTENHVCAIQKAEGKLNRKELMENIEIAFKTGKDIRELFKNLKG